MPLVLQGGLGLVDERGEEVAHEHREKDDEAQLTQLAMHDHLHQEDLVAEEETRGECDPGVVSA